MTDVIHMRDWSTKHHREPVVRIGIVLDEDALATVEFQLPQAEYEVGGANAKPARLNGRPLTARLADGQVALRAGDDPEQTAAVWSLAPVHERPLRQGDGVLVRGVVAGRGFHWQKRVDQTLGGRIEIHPGRRGLIVVNELPLEAYLAGVITSEMSGACPVEFLKAQCVTARSWLLALTEPKHQGEPFDRCNDDCCQRYQGTGDLTAAALEATTATRGLALLDTSGRVVDANYSKSCGGVVETPEHVWGRPKPGLSALVDAPADGPEQRFLPVTAERLDEYLDGPWLAQTRIYCSPNVVPEETLGRYLGRVDESGRYFRWTVTYRREELEDLLRAKLPEARDLAQLRDLRVLERGVSGRAGRMEIDFADAGGRVQTVTLPSEYRIREVLHRKFLYSSAFALRIERDAAGLPATITLRGAGWGHGAGLCQIGALGMALEGIDSAAILRHYFPGATLEQVYP
jgi:stage II sporulation protein D